MDLVANSDSENKDVLLRYRNTEVLPTVAIYGANAAGKRKQAIENTI
ncbi:hypothetical protein SAMN05216515_1612 [Eubacterium pyruvativorans]|uniref:Uncharacterized protein n=1 Tax=Eubacterium pyruvativorans TaxID=155865 RepID=A0A1I7ING9_9FIRM|nr:hypothetical protein SAMN05216515_1612 [Eubacterium pyruvativorans]SFU74434.1 hypothetical protein SAMN05216508_1592 [Eubacterium pyruvativorans]